MKNWRTTLVGFLAGVGNLWASGANMDAKDIGMSAALVALGFLTKDYRVSGARNPDGSGRM